MIDFLVLDNLPVFNIILGRPWIHIMKAVPLTYHQCIRFPGPKGISEVRGNHKTYRACYMSMSKIKSEVASVEAKPEK